ncbi:class I SAM-dependent methyltransferase [Mycobacterium sp. E740]|uniref:class I SAM-dependent methyltransferase n=1 Tax=Mycobacterium sp. E740 TaxID=1834149 RepID=UPI0012EA018C|nr:class I SAM-dependent methyltransferase [Mycobacterium sp. E740]
MRPKILSRRRNVTLLPKQTLDLIKRNPYAYTALRTVRMQAGRFVPPQHVTGVPGRVHFNDFMLVSDEEALRPEGYLGGAESVIALIEEGLSKSGRSFADLRTVLDFGSGYGRVIRLLISRVEPSRVFAADVIREAVAFCESEFGVNPIFPGRGGRLPVIPPMDLIYAISVLTHLPAERGNEVLRAWAKAIEPGGVLLFTTQGPGAADDPTHYGLPESSSADIKARLEKDGFVYEPYAHYLGDDYGVTFHTPEHVAELAARHLPDFEQVAHLPKGLDGHQDVFVYQRRRG